MWCARSFLIVYKNLLAKFIQGFPYWRDGGVLPPTKNFPIHLPPPTPNFYSLPPKVNSTRQKDKNFIFSCSHCSCPIFVLISNSFETQVMLILILIDVQYSQNAGFSFQKFSILQNHSSSCSHHLVKKSPQQCSLLLDKVRETSKILGEKEQ